MMRPTVCADMLRARALHSSVWSLQSDSLLSGALSLWPERFFRLHHGRGIPGRQGVFATLSWRDRDVPAGHIVSGFSLRRMSRRYVIAAVRSSRAKAFLLSEVSADAGMNISAVERNCRFPRFGIWCRRALPERVAGVGLRCAGHVVAYTVNGC